MTDDIVIDEPRVRAYIKGFLDASSYRSNEASVALVEANREAVEKEVWKGEFSDFTFIFNQEWDKTEWVKRYPK